MTGSHKHSIELIAKTVAVLEALRDRPEGLSLQELARQTGQVKSSVHRILQSLAPHGYIEQAARGGVYRLGIQFLALANSVRAGSRLVEIARAHSRSLMEKFEETTYVAVLRGGHGVFVDVQETRRDLRLAGPLGARVHFHATAAGKAMAAFFPEAYRKTLLKGLRTTSIAKRTMLDPVRIAREWDRVRSQGYAINDEETIAGAVFLAAPIFDATGAICGSVSVGLPKTRYSAALGTRIVAELKRCCVRVSSGLKAINYVHENAFDDSAARSALQPDGKRKVRV